MYQTPKPMACYTKALLKHCLRPVPLFRCLSWCQPLPSVFTFASQESVS